MSRLIKGFISQGDLSIDDLVKLVIKPSHKEGCGAIVTYVGFVKAVVDGRKVNHVLYEPDENTDEELTRIATEVSLKYRLHDIIVAHKEGALKPGETVSYVIVSACDRSTAFKAAEETINKVKSEAPIRKVERREDGDFLVFPNGERKPLK